MKVKKLDFVKEISSIKHTFTLKSSFIHFSINIFFWEIQNNVSEVKSVNLLGQSKVLADVHNSEYKRRQAAPGVKISERNFGYDRRYPITNAFRDMEN